MFRNLLTPIFRLARGRSLPFIPVPAIPAVASPPVATARAIPKPLRGGVSVTAAGRYSNQLPS
jgi:hypothetical protein